MDMKKYTIKYILVAFVLILSVSSCFKEPKVQGYIGEGIRLQGSDTMYVALGAKVASSTAWLDNSTHASSESRMFATRRETASKASSRDSRRGFGRLLTTTLQTRPSNR